MEIVEFRAGTHHQFQYSTTPDRNDAPGAEVRFKSITKAYEILSDRAKRDEYNQSVNHRIILDAEAEAYALWRSLFGLHGMALPE
ncbi:MAG: DnaJ domain-containing protein [Thermomonas sp.]